MSQGPGLITYRHTLISIKHDNSDINNNKNNKCLLNIKNF